MAKFLKFLRCPKQRKIIFLQVLFILPLIEVSVRLFSLPHIMKIFKLRDSLPAGQMTDFSSAHREYVTLVYWAIDAVRRNILFMNHVYCLAIALTARHFLYRKNISCTLVLGAQMKGNDGLRAHAWLVHDGRILDFGFTDNQFTELVRFF